MSSKWVYTNTFSWTLPCTQQTKEFVDEKQSKQWLKMHCKRCEKCRGAKLVDAEGFNVIRAVSSPADELLLQQYKKQQLQHLVDLLNS